MDSYLEVLNGPYSTEEKRATFKEMSRRYWLDCWDADHYYYRNPYTGETIRVEKTVIDKITE